jgi:hypothetical protein
MDPSRNGRATRRRAEAEERRRRRRRTKLHRLPHVLQLRRGHHWPHLRRGVERVPHPHAIGRALQQATYFVIRTGVT